MVRDLLAKVVDAFDIAAVLLARRLLGRCVIKFLSEPRMCTNAIFAFFPHLPLKKSMGGMYVTCAILTFCQLNSLQRYKKASKSQKK